MKRSDEDRIKREKIEKEIEKARKEGRIITKKTPQVIKEKGKIRELDGNFRHILNRLLAYILFVTLFSSISYSTALDIAGYAFNGDAKHCFYGCLDGGVKPGIATRTVAVYTNPGKLGTKVTNKADVNILVNPADNYIQPGHEGKKYNHHHLFAMYLAVAFSYRFFQSKEQIMCTDAKYPDINLNFFYNKIPAGEYSLVVKNCYPFCCKKPSQHSAVA